MSYIHNLLPTSTVIYSFNVSECFGEELQPSSKAVQYLGHIRCVIQLVGRKMTNYIHMFIIPLFSY
jgi:hypothetical protein